MADGEIAKIETKFRYLVGDALEKIEQRRATRNSKQTKTRIVIAFESSSHECATMAELNIVAELPLHLRCVHNVLSQYVGLGF